jgi:phage shock protein PspC (stress-responsive transcriptional regulator)
MNTTTDYGTATNPASARPSLSRPAAGRMAGGVAAGVARTLGVDPLIVRIAFVALTLLGAAGIPLYLAGWLLIPDEQTGRSLAAELFQPAAQRG